MILCRRAGRLQFLDPAVRAPQRLVLDQDRLHQRVNRVGRARKPCAIAAVASGSRGAPSIFESRSKRSSTNWRSCGVIELSLASQRRADVGALCVASSALRN